MLDVGLLVSFAGIAVAALAGILGVWMERDREHKPYFAILFSLVIFFASFIELGRAIAVAWQDASTKDAMATVLEQLTELSEKSDDPELASFVRAELSRSDPGVLKRVQKKVAAKGGDPNAVRKRAAEGRRAGSAGVIGSPREKARSPDDGAAGDGKREAEEGKAGKASGGLDGAVDDLGEGKTGKALDDVTGGKAGKAVDGASGAVTEGAKAVKSVEGATEGKAGKAVDGAANAIGGAIGAGKSGKK